MNSYYQQRCDKIGNFLVSIKEYLKENKDESNILQFIINNKDNQYLMSFEYDTNKNLPVFWLGHLMPEGSLSIPIGPIPEYSTTWEKDPASNNVIEKLLFLFYVLELDFNTLIGDNKYSSEFLTKKENKND